ncbi:hypothetical protein L207DRAFT_420686 [Hyaloscypha variabilis F]|uniref:Uncharacterized protein n=1 Tax=Hyaloscypha variabilis (strain UAMH 11265 / GT02V1 / F) TaxID=1149755 RepID=A0A2J6S1B9_HYAVF|nr:hypothetical protein L207DRAFT_420686 [Hyaloscypha variabilis F]
MAFRQPTYHAPQRIYTLPDDTQAQAQAQPSTQPATQPQHIADSQEWILFSPATESTTDRTYTTSTARTRTAGRSRISDFGSLDTAARSYGYDEDGEEAVEEEEEDGELDSLDSHLHEFREPSLYRQGEASGTVLPTHDGLGSFRLDQIGMGEDVQEHLYAFERFNPRRVKRRRESIELGMVELETERAAEAERTRRIETWRMEQSRLLVDEIQRETRRRKQSMSTQKESILADREQEDVATLSSVDIGTEQDEVPIDENESFWNRITRRVIRDLMGIDDDLLSIIFGEALPEDDDLSTTPPAEAARSIIATNRYDQSSWEFRLLERIARELGIMVNQISDHPGAFSTYLHSQQTPLPYAGLPVIPETARDVPTTTNPEDSTITTPQFLPTLQTQTPPVSIPIPTPTTSLASPLPLEDPDSTPRPTNLLSQPLTREEWERDLDLKMVFRYLRSRFVSKFRSAPSPTSLNLDFVGTSHLATASTADTAARAARVRQHHPLVTRQKSNTERDRRRSIERRTWKPSVPGGATGLVGGGVMGHVRRGSSSCASERVSAKGLGKRSGSSRHYWDFGGQSVGSGSLVAGVGGMGSWGEV